MSMPRNHQHRSMNLLQSFVAAFLFSAVSPSLHAGDQVLQNPGFEDGLNGWIPIGPVIMDAQSDDVREGCCAARVGGRTAAWMGIGQMVTESLEPGQSYAVSVWARLVGAEEDDFKLTLRTIDDAGTRWRPLAHGKASEQPGDVETL